MITDSGFDISLQIDGGVKTDNIKEIAEAGVDMFVAGSAIFNSAPRRPRAPTYHSLHGPGPPPPRSTSGARSPRDATDRRERAPHCPTLAAPDYKATIDIMRAELAQVPFPGKMAEVAVAK